MRERHRVRAWDGDMLCDGLAGFGDSRVNPTQRAASVASTPHPGIPPSVTCSSSYDGAAVGSTLQRSKLRHKAVEGLLRGPRAGGQTTLGLNLAGTCPRSPIPRLPGPFLRLGTRCATWAASPRA